MTGTTLNAMPSESLSPFIRFLCDDLSEKINDPTWEAGFAEWLMKNYGVTPEENQRMYREKLATN